MLQAATVNPAQAAMAQAAANAQAAIYQNSHISAQNAAAAGVNHQNGVHHVNQVSQPVGIQQIPVQNGVQVGIPVQNGVNQAVAAAQTAFPVGQLSQEQATMHAQAMQQAQFAMHQQMHHQGIQYLHTTPTVIHPMQTTSQSYHHQAAHQQQQQNININIHNGGGGVVENKEIIPSSSAAATLPIINAAVCSASSDANEVKIEDKPVEKSSAAEKEEVKVLSVDDKSNSEDKKEDK